MYPNRGVCQTVPSDLLHVIPERHFRLWLLQHHGQGYLLDLQRLVHLKPEYAENGWNGWRSAMITPSNRQVAWEHGATFDLATLFTELALPPTFSIVRVLGAVSADSFYRPLIHCVPPPTSAIVLANHVLKSYNIDCDTLAAIHAEYAAPPALLYRRLIDLTLALGAALSMSAENVRDLMHWKWQQSTRRTANEWPTPLAAILQGELQYVEDTLYPHPPQDGWSG